ncbi:hypothetical protein GWL_41870 [Herbaspirillum sp. GW103]|uniref:hypothetical protein n=1 Tax=unclassified Herbaspirillum TaxID=2624150 RepID=UPI00025E32C9|nr:MULTISPECIES: hypothetical protein [unclassified Herbaspirillum]EIJ44748.1 hypothetical protein GWL_41870 [Herbaspirillum sp. GW103]MCI1006850.1 hypothetical protein [Herbaspirillum sp. C7C8]NUT62717.1 hypothetical protein [Herbaspirillum sp. C9C3]
MATIAQSTNSTFKSKFAAVMRNIFVHFVKAHELQAVALVAAEQDRATGSRQLNRMADKFEATQPNLAAELRFIASRG